MMDLQDGILAPGLDVSTQLEAPSALHKRLAGIDLNLLTALEALLDCRNVTHAARRLGQTQPAMSRALGRLRELLGDDLLVRSSTGLKLTVHGEYLATVVPAAMLHIRDLISSRPAEAETRLSISSGLTPAVLPFFLKFQGRQNGPVKLATHKSTDHGIAQLRLRTADFVLGSLTSFADDVETALITQENFVTLVALNRQGLGGARPSLQTYLSIPQINLVENGTEIFPQLSEALFRHDIRRSAMIEIPDVTTAALMVSEGDMALTVPRSVAGWLSKTLRLAVLLPPIPIAPERIWLAWLAGPERQRRRRTINDVKAVVVEALTQDQVAGPTLHYVNWDH